MMEIIIGECCSKGRILSSSFDGMLMFFSQLSD